jgi:hypothetical protein
VVLFDGTEASLKENWVSLNDGGPVTWVHGPGYVEVRVGDPRPGDIRSKREFGDGQYHVEWASPAEVVSKGQGRGNSGFFLLGLYEIQILDGYENPTYADGTVGGVYGHIPPLVNAVRPPGEWNVYDVAWVGPRFAGERVVSPGRVTLMVNGVYVHNAVEVMGRTTFRKVPEYAPHPAVGPVVLQDHLNPVRFRNIWYRPFHQYDQGDPASPVRSALVR